MAKFFLTNNPEWYQKAKEIINASDFKLAFDYAENGTYALTTHKLKFNNVNAYHAQNGDFAIATGTAIYKESLDYSRLLQYYSGDIIATRKNSIGQYAYIISKNNQISVFGDRAAAYDIYYYIGDDNIYFVANNLFDMVSVIRERVTLHEMNLIEYASTFNVFGGETIFKEIKRLEGEQYLLEKDGVMSLCAIANLNMFPLIKDKSTDEVAKQLAERLSYKAGVIGKILGTPIISMTGGLDSRILLASYLSAGVKPVLLQGRSNTYLSSPMVEDKIVLDWIAQRYSLPSRVVEWDTRDPERSWGKYLQKYGFLYRHWGGSEPIYHTYENLETSNCSFGFGGELYRNTFPEPSSEAPYSIDDMLEGYSSKIYNTNKKSYLISPYKEHIKQKLQKIALKYKFNPKSITKNEVFYFAYEFSKFGDTLPVNLLNLMSYVPQLLYEADCLELARIQYEEKNAGRLMLMTMKLLVPDIIDIPIFSHCQMWEVDKNSMTLAQPDNVRDVYRSKSELLLKRIYQHAKRTLKPLRNVYRAIENRCRPLRNNCYELPKELSQQKSFIPYKINFVDPRPAIYYKMLANALEKLGFPYTIE